MSTPLEPVDPAEPKKIDPIDNLTENLQLFWFKYQNAIYAVVVVILLAIIGKGVWDWNKERVETAIGAEYAAAGASTDKLRAFVTAHEGHTLSGVALLRIADEAYSLAKYSDAAVAYDKALTALGSSPFAARARLGVAVSKLLAGNAAEGVTALRQLAEDATAFKGLRAEAASHLVAASVDAGKVEDAKKFCDLLLQIDASGSWAQRALALRATLPEDPAPATPAAPAADDTKLELKLPIAPGK
jgi:hypothetical protein